jgi:hypothetical protein
MSDINGAASRLSPRKSNITKALSEHSLEESFVMQVAHALAVEASGIVTADVCDYFIRQFIRFDSAQQIPWIIYGHLIPFRVRVLDTIGIYENRHHRHACRV